MSKLTVFGKELRKLRIDRDNESLMKMAERLGVSSSFLSAVELGRKAPPQIMVGKLIQAYGLTSDRAEELHRASMLAAGEVRIGLEGSTNDVAKELAVAFARAFPTMTPDQAGQLMRAMKQPPGGDT